MDVSRIRNHQGQTCIHVATEHGNTDTLRKLKSIGVDMNVEVCVCVCACVCVRVCVWRGREQRGSLMCVGRGVGGKIFSN